VADDTRVEDRLRQLAPEVLGAVVRWYGSFDLAEDAVQEAFLAASLQWPREGVPDRPRAWLIRVASRRLTDLLRGEQARRRREDSVARWTVPEQQVAPPRIGRPRTPTTASSCCFCAVTQRCRRPRRSR
jgi:predicted RNA polymerase sigma factor